MWDMCHYLRGWKSKVLDKWIREIKKEPMRKWHVAKRTSHLTKLDQISMGKRKLEKKKGRKKRENKKDEREALPSL